jgi:hypothetical protein
MAWTNLGTGNVSSNDVEDILDGSSPLNADLAIDDYIGQQNNGVQNTLFDSNATSRASRRSSPDRTWPVPIVGHQRAGRTAMMERTRSSCFRGWALFHVVSAEKRSGTARA